MKTMNGFMHGVNLGGWFSQCVHTTEHYDSFISEEDIRRTVSEAHLRLKRGEPAPAEQVSDRGDETPCSK